MEDRGAASEDQVVLAWLQAQIESPDFQAYIVGNPPNPANLSAALKAARSPDLHDQAQNELRRQIIGSAFGFGQGSGSVTGLGDDITWRRVRLTTDEVAEMLYARHEGAWQLLSPVTRKVAEGATNIGHVFTGDSTNMVVLSLASGLCHSEKKVPEIIALKRPSDGRMVILEGHARATAIVLEAHRFPKGVDVFVGEGASVAGWAYL
ncbi:MAG TPA: hypothetical protein VJR46_08935 [Candidatus Dormibacteraeota bacterium]|nr:hypothetical protein [Candidatus Dormibacteraeota bacterium]